MQKVLIYTTEPLTQDEVETLLTEQGVMVKSTSDLSIATEWLKGWDYDVLIVSDDLDEGDLRSLGGALWARNSSAMAIATSFKGEMKEAEAFYKMYGFTPIAYSDLLSLVLSLDSGHGSDGTNDKDPFRILVVEDLDSPRDIICIFIESLGYSEVQGCRSASEGLTLLEKDPDHFSCIVTDIRMPKINGKEMIEIIRSHPKLQHLPIVVLTAYGTLDMLVDCLRVGASGFLVKPPKKDDMLRELSRAVRISEKKEHPRLASHQEAEYIRKMVEGQKVT